jgi:hypothetical protein
MPKKKTAPKKKAAPKAAKKTTTQTHPLFKPYLADEQARFHRDHPNAQFLITVFLLLFVALAATYVYRFVR